MPSKQTYRELQDKLDTVLAELQAEDVDVDTALAKYQEGLKLVEQLEVRLKLAQNSVRELKKSAE
jgi:exodeoxyribonuclease VII small subunit